MKKFISIFLSVAIVLSLAACGKAQTPPSDNQISVNNEATGDKDIDENSSDNSISEKAVFASNRIITTSGGVKTINDLSNTYYKLTHNKELTIGYMGGSVTDGSGGTNGYCWRTAITQWFKDEFPNAKITEADGSQGNKSSLWGYYRIDDWVKAGQEASLIDAKPDLVFLEFAINDWYVRFTEQRVIHYMEGMIRKLRNSMPDTDIVIILITDEGYIGKDLPTADANKKLAAHYGIPVIDVGAQMNDYINSKGIEFDSLYTDNVHPNNDGYKVYADIIAKYLKDKLITNPSTTSGVKACQMPENWLQTGGSCESDIILASEISEIADTSDFKLYDTPGNAVKIGKGGQLFATSGAELEFELECTGVALMIEGETSTVVKCEIDDKETTAASIQNKIHNELLVVENLTPGKHKIKLTFKSGRRFIIGALLIEK